MKKNFVRFYSPGTFVSETTVKEIDEWDVDIAVEMAKSIKERHGATPYGFMFFTKERGENELDSKQTLSSPTYYLGGKVETLSEIEAKHDPKNKILIDNMRSNKWDKVVTNTNSWTITQPLYPGDVVLDVDLTKN